MVEIKQSRESQSCDQGLSDRYLGAAGTFLVREPSIQLVLYQTNDPRFVAAVTYSITVETAFKGS
jgi:hypothetical protein